jgi:hypothetical protein
MKPRRHGSGAAESAGPSGEDEENRLEHVLGRVVVACDPASHPEDHRSVSVDQGGECVLVAGLGELPY